MIIDLNKRQITSLTLNCIRYPALPLVHKKTTFPPEFGNYLYTIYIYTLITTKFQGKKYEIFVRFHNGGQITDFHFASFRFRPKFEEKKNAFPKEFFNEIWFKLGDHQYINIAEVKFV